MTLSVEINQGNKLNCVVSNNYSSSQFTLFFYDHPTVDLEVEFQTTTTTPIVRPDPLPAAVGLFTEDVASFAEVSGWTSSTGISFTVGSVEFDGSQPSQINFQHNFTNGFANQSEHVVYCELERSSGQINDFQAGGGGADTFGSGSVAISRNAVHRELLTSTTRSVGRARPSNSFVGSISYFNFYDVQSKIDGPLDIYLMLGQSNMAGVSAMTGSHPSENTPELRAFYSPSLNFNSIGAETDGSGPSINSNLSVNEGIGKPLLIAEPCQHAKASNGLGISPVKGAASVICESGTEPGRTPIFICGAAGDTNISGGEWDPDGDGRYFDLAVAQALYYLSLNPENSVKAIFWCQGESDGVSGYASKLNSIVGEFRSLLGQELSFVIMEIGRTVSASSGMILEQQKLATGSGDVSELLNCIYVPRPQNAVLESDGIHFTGSTNNVRGAEAAEALLSTIYQ